MKKIVLLFLLAGAVFGWQKIFDITSLNEVHDFIELPDGSYIVVWATQEPWEEDKLHIWKLDESGDTIWTKEYGDLAIYDDGSSGFVVQYSESTFVAGGYLGTAFEPDGQLVTIMHMNFDGDIIWSRVDTPYTHIDYHTYGEYIDIDYEGSLLSNDGARFTSFNSSGDCISYGHCNSYFWDFRIRAVRDMKCVGFPPYGTVFVGDSYVPLADNSIGYMVYMNAEYDTVWTYHYGATGTMTTDNDALFGVEVIRNPARGCPQGFIGVGRIYHHSDTSYYGYIVRTDMDGEIVWAREFGPGPQDTTSYQFCDIVWTGREEFQTRFAVVGRKFMGRESSESTPVMFFISDTLDGDSLWTKTYTVDYDETVNKLIWHIASCRDGGFLMGSRLSLAESTTWHTIGWFCRVDSLGNDVPYAIEEPHVSATPFPEQLEVVVYPNPFNSAVEIFVSAPDAEKVDVKIFDISGKHVRNLSCASGKSFIWNGRNKEERECPSGTYIYKATCDDVEYTGSVLFIK